MKHAHYAFSNILKHMLLSSYIYCFYCQSLSNIIPLTQNLKEISLYIYNANYLIWTYILQTDNIYIIVSTFNLILSSELHFHEYLYSFLYLYNIFLILKYPPLCQNINICSRLDWIPRILFSIQSAFQVRQVKYVISKWKYFFLPSLQYYIFIFILFFLKCFF